MRKIIVYSLFLTVLGFFSCQDNPKVVEQKKPRVFPEYSEALDEIICSARIWHLQLARLFRVSDNSSKNAICKEKCISLVTLPNGNSSKTFLRFVVVVKRFTIRGSQV